MQQQQPVKEAGSSRLLSTVAAIRPQDPTNQASTAEDKTKEPVSWNLGDEN
jgi:hypothetical protein